MPTPNATRLFWGVSVGVIDSFAFHERWIYRLTFSFLSLGFGDGAGWLLLKVVLAWRASSAMQRGSVHWCFPSRPQWVWSASDLFAACPEGKLSLLLFSRAAALASPLFPPRFRGNNVSVGELRTLLFGFGGRFAMGIGGAVCFFRRVGIGYAPL